MVAFSCSYSRRSMLGRSLTTMPARRRSEARGGQVGRAEEVEVPWDRWASNRLVAPKARCAGDSYSVRVSRSPMIEIGISCAPARWYSEAHITGPVAGMSAARSVVTNLPAVPDRNVASYD